MATLLSKLQAQQTKSVRTIETVELTVTSIIPLKEDKCPKDKNGNVIPKSQINTKEVGVLFCFDSAIRNKPASFAYGAKASVSLEEVTYEKEGKEATTINVLRCEFTTVDEQYRTAGAYGVTVAVNAN